MELVEIAIFSPDVEQSTRFYEQLLGPPAQRWPGGAVFDMGGVKLLIHERYEAGEGDLPPEDHIAFGADDVDSACSELQRQGYAVAFPARDYEWGRSAYLRDPGGRLVEIHQP